MKAHEAHKIALERSMEKERYLEQVIPQVLSRIEDDIEYSASRGDFCCFISIVDVVGNALRLSNLIICEETFPIKAIKKYCIAPIKKNLKRMGYTVRIRYTVDDFIIEVVW